MVNPGVSPWKLMRMGERTTLHSIMSLGSHSWWLSQANSKKIPVKHIHLPNKKCDKYHHLAPLYDCLEKFTSRVVIFLDKKSSPALSNPKKFAESLLESWLFCIPFHGIFQRSYIYIKRSHFGKVLNKAGTKGL